MTRPFALLLGVAVMVSTGTVLENYGVYIDTSPPVYNQKFDECLRVLLLQPYKDSWPSSEKREEIVNHCELIAAKEENKRVHIFRVED